MNGNYLSLIWVTVILTAVNGQQQNMDVLFEKFLQHSGRKNLKSQGLNNINMQDPASLPVMYTLFKQILQFTHEKNSAKSATNPNAKSNQVKSSQTKNGFNAMQQSKATGTNSQQNFKFKPKQPSFSMPAVPPKNPQNTNLPTTKKQTVPKTKSNFNSFPTKSPSFQKRPVTQHSVRTSVTKPPMPNQNGQTANTATMWGNFNSRQQQQQQQQVQQQQQQQQQQRPNTQTRPRTFREFSSQMNSPSGFNTGAQSRQPPSPIPNTFNQAPPMNFGNNPRFPPHRMNQFRNFQNPGFVNFQNKPQTPPTPESLWGNFGNNGGPPNPPNQMNNNNNNNINAARMVSNPASEQTFEEFLMSMAQGMMQPNGPMVPPNGPMMPPNGPMMQPNRPKNPMNAPKPNTFTTASPPTTPTPAPTTTTARPTPVAPTISNPASMPGNNNNQGQNMDIQQLWDTLMGIGSSNNAQPSPTGSPNGPFPGATPTNNNIRPPNIQATTVPPTTTVSIPLNFPMPNMNSLPGFGAPPSGGRSPGRGGPPNMGGPPNAGGAFNMQNMRNMLQMMMPLEYFVQDPVTGTFAAEQIEMLTPSLRRIRSETSGPTGTNVEIFIDKGTSMGQGIFMFESPKCYIGVISENKQYLAALQNVSQTVNPGQVILKKNHIPFMAMEIEPLTFTALRRISPMIANECEGKQSVYIQPAGMLPPSPSQKCFATAAAEYCIQPPISADYFKVPTPAP